MSEEEKKAIEYIKHATSFYIDEYGVQGDYEYLKIVEALYKYLKIVENLIEKQHKEIEELRKYKGKHSLIKRHYISKDKIREILKKYSEKEDCTYIELIDFVEEIKQLLEE